MKTIALALLLSLTALAGEIKHPILTQDLHHPPRLFACMKGLLGFEVRGFHGPFFGTTHGGNKDRGMAVYIVRGKNLEKYYWHLKATPGSEFKWFGYDTPQGLAFGMFGPSMDTASALTDKPYGTVIADIDLSPCIKFLARP